MVGPIPDGLTIDHVKKNGCTSKLCVKAVADDHRPAHLEAVTMRENLLRAQPPPHSCPAGHPYNETNTYTDKKGGHHCRICDRERRRIRRNATKRYANAKSYTFV
jgi:hypothetical protein